MPEETGTPKGGHRRERSAKVSASKMSKVTQIKNTESWQQRNGRPLGKRQCGNVPANPSNYNNFTAEDPLRTDINGTRVFVIGSGDPVELARYLMLLAGDVEQNLGPGKQCSLCERQVSHDSIRCTWSATGYIGGVQSCQKYLQTLAKSQSYRLECSTCEKVRRKNPKRKQTETHRAAERTRNEKRK